MCSGRRPRPALASVRSPSASRPGPTRGAVTPVRSGDGARVAFPTSGGRPCQAPFPAAVVTLAVPSADGRTGSSGRSDRYRAPASPGGIGRAIR